MTSTSDLLLVQVRCFGVFSLALNVEHVTGIKKADAYEYPDPSFPLAPFHQAHVDALGCFPSVVLSDNVDCDLIADARLMRFNRNFAGCLLSSAHDVDDARVQWYAERHELNAGVR